MMKSQTKHPSPHATSGSRSHLLCLNIAAALASASPPTAAKSDFYKELDKGDNNLGGTEIGAGHNQANVRAFDRSGIGHGGGAGGQRRSKKPLGEVIDHGRERLHLDSSIDLGHLRNMPAAYVDDSVKTGARHIDAMIAGRTASNKLNFFAGHYADAGMLATA